MRGFFRLALLPILHFFLFSLLLPLPGSRRFLQIPKCPKRRGIFPRVVYLITIFRGRFSRDFHSLTLALFERETPSLGVFLSKRAKVSEWKSRGNRPLHMVIR